MNKEMLKKRFNKLKRTVRNKMRGTMRKIVNFALADEVEPEVIDEEIDVEPEVIDENEENKKIDILINIKKIKQYAKLALMIFIVYKFGKRRGSNIIAKSWNDFFTNLTHGMRSTITDDRTGRTYKIVAELIK